VHRCSYTHSIEFCIASAWPVLGLSIRTTPFLHSLQVLPPYSKGTRISSAHRSFSLFQSECVRSCAASASKIIQLLNRLFFQSSAVLEIIRTAGRVALTFIPVILVKNHASRRLLKRIEMVKKESGDSALPRPVKELVAKQGNLLQSIRRRTILFHALIFTPCILFWAAVIASLERTPLTGR
jgi:hypothetical protein